MCDPCWDNFLYREDVEAERGERGEDPGMYLDAEAHG
jgi:hypothetical protein